jgi:hypothetical protein
MLTQVAYVYRSCLDWKKSTVTRFIGKILHIKLFIIIDRISPLLVDHTRYFRHAPVRLRVDANMCDFARGCAAVCLPRPPRFA